MPRPAGGSLVVGRVGRPHGLDGSFHVTQPRADLLREGAEVTVSPPGSRARIVRRAGTDQRPIVRLDAASDRDAAAGLRGSEMQLDIADAPPLEQDEYLAEQLIGCTALAGTVPLGTVTALLALPSCECLEVKRENGQEILVPMVRDAIRSIDVGRRVIEVNGAFLGLADGPDATEDAGPGSKETR